MSVDETRVGAQSHPDGDRCDLEFCQRCGHAFTTALEGYWIESDDIGPDAEGDNAHVFREDIEQCGNEFLGFEEEDMGAWCESCSWVLQRRRERVVRGVRSE